MNYSLDAIELIIGAITGIFMANIVPNRGNTNNSKRQKADGIHTYFIQLYLVTPVIAFMSAILGQKVYDKLTFGRLGSELIEAYPIVYKYGTKVFALLIQAIATYWFMLIFFKYTKKMYGKHKAVVRYRVFAVLSFVTIVIPASYHIVSGSFIGTLGNYVVIAGWVGCIAMGVMQLIDWAKENRHWV